MAISITIHGDCAAEVLQELQRLASGTSGRTEEDQRPEVKAADWIVGNAQNASSVAATVATSPTPEVVELDEPTDEGIEVDTDGVPFDESIHTGTKTKDGRWRMKKGAVRPESSVPNQTGSMSTESNGAETFSESGDAASESAGDPGIDEDDEFAAFKEAAAQIPETPAVPVRTWTDADLGQLCNDAAVKLNDPAPVKALIAKFAPEGTVPHSRNIPNADREAFAQAIEETAGIEYAG